MQNAHDNPILTPAKPCQPGPTSSLATRRLDDARAQLDGSDPDLIVMGLMPVLALVGASGMTQADREEWLHAAVDALRHIPSDLLSGSIARAKANCDHPSKVIPFIVKDVAPGLSFRRRHLADLEERERHYRALPAPGQSFCTAEEAREIVDTVFPQARELAPQRTAHVPTADDYIALGHSPEAAAKIMAQFHKPDPRQIGQHVSKATEWRA